MTIKTRVYTKKIEINNDNVKEFWNNRANIDNLNSVLLGNQNNHTHSDLRNKKEVLILKKLLGDRAKHLKILDIGCGIGRWAKNLLDDIEIYHGIDYSKGFINKNNETFKNYTGIKFFLMSASNLDLSKLNKTYDLVIINGVLMYINDNNINNVFQMLNQINPHFIYLQESISTMKHRMTLNKFYSEELQTNYSAIYRTLPEYEKYLNNLENYKTNEKGLLLDYLTGARTETNAFYWFLEKENNNDWQ